MLSYSKQASIDSVAPWMFSDAITRQCFLSIIVNCALVALDVGNSLNQNIDISRMNSFVVNYRRPYILSSYVAWIPLCDYNTEY